MIPYPLKATSYRVRRHGVNGRPWRNSYPGILWGLSASTEGTDWLYELVPGGDPDDEAAWVRIGPLAFTVDNVKHHA